MGLGLTIWDTPDMKTTVPFSVLDAFQSLLEEDDQFNEAMMRVALMTAHLYNPGEDLDEQDYELAMELCTRVSVS